MRLILLLVFLSHLLFGDLLLKDETQNFEHFSVAYEYDKTSKLKIDEISQKKFNKLSSSQFTFGYLDGTTWFKIKIQNSSNTNEFFLSFSEPFFEKLNLYEYKNSQWNKKEAGLFTPLDEREIQSSNPAFMLHINPGESKTYYIETFSMFAQVGEFTICTEKYFFANSTMTSSLLYMFYFGGITIVILLNIFLFITLKDRLYAYYTAYVFFTAGFIFILSGFDILLGLASIHYELHMAASMLIVFLILFSNYFLNIKNYFPFIHKILQTLVYVFLILSALIIVDIEPWYELMNVLATLTFITLIYASMRIWRTGQTRAKYYSLIMIFYIISLALFSSVFIGLIENNDFNRYSFLFISFLEIGFFSLILANDFNTTKEEKIKIQAELINQKNIYAHKLEAQVKERTIELEETQVKLKTQTYKDPLTNLYNRRYLSDIAEKTLQMAKKHNQELSILLIDIDKFKNINDKYGHASGDETIKSIAKQLEKIARESDIIFRYGGEEYLILLPNTLINNAITLAKRIRIAIQNSSIVVGNNEISVTISIGVSKLENTQDTSIENAIQRADINLYKAKERGRNIVVSSLD